MWSKVFIAAVSGWFFCTCLVDFVAIPNIFRTVQDVSEAGKVGMKVFKLFNMLEGFFAVVILISALKTKFRLENFIAGVLLCFTLGYNFYLTPKITEVSKEMMTYDKLIDEQDMDNKDMSLAAKFDKASEDHSFYHHLYVKLDGVKLVLILILLVMGFLPKRERGL